MLKWPNWKRLCKAQNVILNTLYLYVIKNLSNKLSVHTQTRVQMCVIQKHWNQVHTKLYGHIYNIVRKDKSKSTRILPVTLCFLRIQTSLKLMFIIENIPSKNKRLYSLLAERFTNLPAYSTTKYTSKVWEL